MPFYGLREFRSYSHSFHSTIQRKLPITAAVLCFAAAITLSGCSQPSDFPSNPSAEEDRGSVISAEEVSDETLNAIESATTFEENPSDPVEEKAETTLPSKPGTPTADELRAKLNITEDFRSSFVHGSKPASCQKYIVLHDTEGGDSAQSVIDWWDSNGNMVAAHFVVNKDGSIWQCAPLDGIVHHAGFGDTGHNEFFGTVDESRDDKRGTTPIGDWAADYGMNSYSIGIEMVHEGSESDYPKAQLEALDGLIAYIDAYYGFESAIIDHKNWRSGNSDTSEEFAQYLQSYQAIRKHASS